MGAQSNNGSAWPKLALSKLKTNRSYCDANQIEIIRRCSGGQTIVTGPGCLMYAVLLDYRRRPELRMLDRAHEFVIGKMKTAIQTLGIPGGNERDVGILPSTAGNFQETL